MAIPTADILVSNAKPPRAESSFNIQCINWLPYGKAYWQPKARGEVELRDEVGAFKYCKTVLNPQAASTHTQTIDSINDVWQR